MTLPLRTAPQDLGLLSLAPKKSQHCQHWLTDLSPSPGLHCQCVQGRRMTTTCRCVSARAVEKPHLRKSRLLPARRMAVARAGDTKLGLTASSST